MYNRTVFQNTNKVSSAPEAGTLKTIYYRVKTPNGWHKASREEAEKAAKNNYRAQRITVTRTTENL